MKLKLEFEYNIYIVHFKDKESTFHFKWLNLYVQIRNSFI